MSFNLDDSDEGGEPETYADLRSELLWLKEAPPSDTVIRSNACRNCRSLRMKCDKTKSGCIRCHVLGRVCDFGGQGPVGKQLPVPSTDLNPPAKSSVRKSIPTTTLESRKVQHGIEAHGRDSQRDKKMEALVEAHKLKQKNWRSEKFHGDAQIPGEAGLGVSSNHIAPGQEVPHPVGSGSYLLPERVSYFPSRLMDLRQIKKQDTFGEGPLFYSKPPLDMSSAPGIIEEGEDYFSQIVLPAPANPNASSSPQASSNSLLKGSQIPQAPDFGRLSVKIHMNTEKGNISHLSLHAPANPNASSSPQASSNPLLQNTQNPWVPGFGWLPTQTPVNTNNSYGADYPDYGPPPHVPNAWKGSQGYGRKQFWGCKPENNGKAEADKISFNPIQLLLADRLCVGNQLERQSGMDRGINGAKPEGTKSWWEFFQRGSLEKGIMRLEWTCKCGHRSHDDFQELSPGAIIELAMNMFKAGYITHAQISGQTKSPASSLIINVQNTFNGARRRISSLRSSTLPIFNTKSSPMNSIALPCLPSQRCRWLHMCLRKPPYATKLEPLHVCKDEEEKDFTDATFFRALRRAYFGSKSLRERLLFKLKKIEFVEFELCPENLVDHILPDKFPPTLDEYDFLPPPPLKKCPPIGTSHMMHLFTSCSAQPLNTNLYLRHIPKRKEQALSFRPDLVDAVTGWGLHFVESLNSALAVTVMFVVSLVLGIVFAICWCIWRQDVQGAFGVASYVTSVITLAAMTWQMWAF